MSSTGTIDLDVERLAHAGVDDGDRAAACRWRRRGRRGTGRSRRAGAGWPTARCAATGWSVMASRRSRVRDRWAPRLVAARAWISSMITASTPRRVSRACGGEHEVERLGRGDEQVRRVAQHPAALVGRGVARADADRSAGGTAARGARRPARCRRGGCAGSSRRRRRGPAAARRRGGGCGARGPPGGGVETSRSRPHRKAASVLPDPVGARIRVWSPEAMAGQPWACGGVASAKVVENQARTGSEKRSSGSVAVTRPRLPTGKRAFTPGPGLLPSGYGEPRWPGVARAREGTRHRRGHLVRRPDGGPPGGGAGRARRLRSPRPDPPSPH